MIFYMILSFASFLLINQAWSSFFLNKDPDYRYEGYKKKGKAIETNTLLQKAFKLNTNIKKRGGVTKKWKYKLGCVRR